MSKAGAHLHPTGAHAPTSMSPNTFRPPTITFNPSIFPLSLLLHLPPYVQAAGGALLLLPGKGREGKVRPSPLLCLPLSFLSSVAPPSSIHPSLSALLTACPIPSQGFAFDIQRSVWSGVERSEERRGRNSCTTVNFRPFNSVNPSAISRLLARTCSHSVLPVITPAPHCSSAWPEPAKKKKK